MNVFCLAVLSSLKMQEWEQVGILLNIYQKLCYANENQILFKIITY